MKQKPSIIDLTNLFLSALKEGIRIGIILFLAVTIICYIFSNIKM